MVEEKKYTGYYIHFEGRKISGIAAKIDAQLKELNKLGKCIEIEGVCRRRNLFQKFISVAPFGYIPWDYREILKSIDMIPEYIYIRKTTIDRGYLGFLRLLRNRFSKTKIIVEYPSFPYVKELFRTFVFVPYGIKDIVYRSFIKKYIDRAVTFSYDEKIYGTRTIIIKNGIDVGAMELPVREQDNGIIDILAVASIQPQHGYERLIEGLSIYYKNGGDRTIVFHIVGDGPEKRNLERIVFDLHLEDKVIFYGFKNHNELYDFYSFTDIAVDSFGDYKVGRCISSGLKVREYLACGLPIVSGCREDIFDEHKEYQYFLEFENKPGPLDISKIICFYDNITRMSKCGKNIRNEIRNFAKRYCDINVTMKPIIEYIKYTVE